jgi:hypothetical protein
VVGFFTFEGAMKSAVFPACKREADARNVRPLKTHEQSTMKTKVRNKM